MDIRKATINDIDAILSVLESGREYLQSQGLSQWQNGFGPSRHVAEDVSGGCGYVLVTGEGAICGYAALLEGVDECYTNIKEGCWDDAHTDYISIHSVAIKASFRGKSLSGLFMRKLIEAAQSMGYRDIRIDTHPQNVIMQKVILRAGFTYRGMIEFGIPDGKRVAYQLSNNQRALLCIIHRRIYRE